MIDFNCSRCGALLSVPDSIIGAQETCPGCGSVLTVPRRPQAVAPPPQSSRADPRGYTVYPPPTPPLPAAVQPYPYVVHKPKSPTVALVLSLLIVGLGQFYNDDPKKGGIMLGIAIVGGLISCGAAWLGVAIWSAIDAYQVASGKSKRW
ncbi:MAG: hypothetical protein ACE15C_21140 [Phycisphaerae bacterium]